jgi:hypothetical protein
LNLSNNELTGVIDKELGLLSGKIEILYYWLIVLW